MSVEVLGQREFVDAWHPYYETRVLIVVAQHTGFVAVSGVPTVSPLPPALAPGVSPVAEVRVPACARVITNQNITRLDATGEPE